MFYVYLIKSHSKGVTYIGYSSNLRRRIKEHWEKKPELIYYEAYKDRRDAQRREKMLKERGQSVRRLKERLLNSLI